VILCDLQDYPPSGGPWRAEIIDTSGSSSDSSTICDTFDPFSILSSPRNQYTAIQGQISYSLQFFDEENYQ
jgi:hypothetical protein